MGPRQLFSLSGLMSQLFRLTVEISSFVKGMLEGGDDGEWRLWIRWDPVRQVSVVICIVIIVREK